MELQIINQQKVFGKTFTIYGTADDPLFLAKDVADWIEHNKPNEMIGNVDEDDKLTSQIATAGQNRNMVVINESGLYSLILSSKLPLNKSKEKKKNKCLRVFTVFAFFI